MDIDDEVLIEEWEDDSTFSSYLDDSVLFSNFDNHGSGEKNQASEEDENCYGNIDSDLDYAIALSLQTSLENENAGFHNNSLKASEASKPISIVDEQWELIDPVPDIHALFIEFDNKFFYGKLKCVEVRWSPRMTLCAGICSYQGRGGLCSIGLSVPLLKLRPRRDLVETLLHEMIHAYLFVTANYKDHSAHGPEFIKHMERINKEAGTKITVYHSFHAEVALYKQHWWKCDGPCRNKSPYYGVVKRAMNRAPGPKDFWWAAHQSSCGGKYVKIKEPSGYSEKKLPKKKLLADSKNKTPVPDIRKFVGVGSPSLPPKSESKNPEGLDVTSQPSVSQKLDFPMEVPTSSATNSTEALEKENFKPFQGMGHKLGSSETYQGPAKFSSVSLKDLHFERNKNLYTASTKEIVPKKDLSPSPAEKIVSPKRDLSFYFSGKSPSQEKSPLSSSSKMTTLASHSRSTKAPEFSAVPSLKRKDGIPTPATSSKSKRFDTSTLEEIWRSTSTFVNKDPPKEISSSNSNIPSSMVKNVYCPVCSNLVEEEINLHLDTCLKS